MVSRNHYVDVGDAQRAGEEVATCSCGWRTMVSDSDELTKWERHVELMALSYGHVYANAWMIPETVETVESDGIAPVLVADGLGGGA